MMAVGTFTDSGSRTRRRAGYALCWLAMMLLLAALWTGGDVRAASQGAPVATGFVVRLPAVPGVPAAGYGILRSATPVLLVGVTSPDARSIELHRSVIVGGVMRMDPVPALPVRGAVTLSPHGLHLMIFGLGPVRPGGAVRLVFHFRGAPDVTATARALAPAGTVGAPMPDMAAR